MFVILMKFAPTVVIYLYIIVLEGGIEPVTIF